MTAALQTATLAAVLPQDLETQHCWMLMPQCYYSELVTEPPLLCSVAYEYEGPWSQTSYDNHCIL